MIRIRNAIVLDVLEENEEYQELVVQIDENKGKAVNYPRLTGQVQKGDIVYLNTTAVNIGLGTGGVHFVLANNNLEKDSRGHGHIMKMRYTPQQIKVLAVEEEASPHHELIKDFNSLQNTPVVIAFLHSMLISALAGIRCINENLKISYIMTDGGALPLAFSKTINLLKKEKWLTGTLTSGHAFGGDLETINVYSALVAAFMVQKPDLIIIAMGPGNVGTGTEFGTTALEAGQIINAVYSLGGHPILIPRISFQDKRNRHQGISHHVITVLNKIALAPCSLVLPKLHDVKKYNYLEQQIKDNKLNANHKLIYESGAEGLAYLKKSGISVTTMGRSFDEDQEFFLTASAAGAFAARLV
ncbi:MAG: hypothetical protein JM58_14250 [Peptococcaceae bacterium BICA1-8]|nr:MAG: hypothetical protein JM58_14250 [Peptococcaceae bacterium BICA1-8]